MWLPTTGASPLPEEEGIQALKLRITCPRMNLRLALAQRHACDDWGEAVFHDNRTFSPCHSTRGAWHLPGEMAMVSQGEASSER